MGIWCCWTGLMLGGGRPFESKTKGRKNYKITRPCAFNTWQITQEANIDTLVRSVRLKRCLMLWVFLWLPNVFPDRSMFLIKIMATLCCCYQSWIIFAIKTHTLRWLTFISEAKAMPGNNSCSLEAVLGVVIPSLNTNTCTETDLITCWT